MSAYVRGVIIDAGVRNLKEGGYPNVTAENILTDEACIAVFKRMLEDEKEKAKGQVADVVNAVEQLLKELEAQS